MVLYDPAEIREAAERPIYETVRALHNYLLRKSGIPENEAQGWNAGLQALFIEVPCEICCAYLIYFGGRMYRTLVFAALLFLPTFSSAGKCNVPVFETFAVSNAPGSSENLPLQIDMQPVAKLRIPSGFSKIGVLPEGSIGFGQHPEGVSAVLLLETKASISIHKKGVKPAQFMLSIFKGLNSYGCRYLQGFQLESEDYRLHAKLGKGAELFAYGKGATHKFYLIRPDRPDFVLTGLFKNISRIEFESILSTLTLE